MNGHIAANSLNRYLVNTEGTIVRKGSSEYMAGVDAGTQAADGMRLERAYATVGASADQLDSAEQFSAGVQRIVDSLADLAKAPVIPAEYHGPVLFTGDASSDIFARLLSSPVAALRPDIGTTERTRGPYSSGYQTRVLPDFLKIVDDPALASFDGKALLGSYAVDDEGVPSQSVTLVDQGKLVNYLIGRQPVKDFAESNGHGRAGAGGPPHPAIAVLHIEAEKSVPDQALNQKLLTLGKDQGLDAVYEVETFGPSLTPRLLYKIDVATGKRELVRGAALADLDLRALRSEIRAAGDTTYVDNIFGNPASTILAPPLLIDDVTVKRAEQPNQKLPYYPPPD
jgi:TldD protein